MSDDHTPSAVASLLQQLAYENTRRLLWVSGIEDSIQSHLKKLAPDIPEETIIISRRADDFSYLP